MKSEEILRGIDKVLDIWDPIGVSLHWPEMYENANSSSGEYTKYVKPIIDVFLAKKSIYDHLVTLHIYLIGIDVNGEDWEEAKNFVLEATESINSFLSTYTQNELKEALNYDLPHPPPSKEYFDYQNSVNPNQSIFAKFVKRVLGRK
jgi:hypothetical protein